MLDFYWYLKNSDLFSQLTAYDAQHLESVSRVRRYKRGEAIYEPFDAADNVLLVAQGLVTISHVSADGKRSILSFVDAGEIFGELCLAAGDVREEHAEATEPTTVVVIPKLEMLRLMSRYHHVSLGITRIIGVRRQVIERRLRNLLFRSNRERIIYLLIEMAAKYGVEADEGLELSIRLSHQEIAGIIGSTRETVTVMLGHLQNEGIIRIARRRITILQFRKLRAEVNDTAEPAIPTSASRFGFPAIKDSSLRLDQHSPSMPIPNSSVARPN
jgi:CRP-like cAMP-binding protein